MTEWEYLRISVSYGESGVIEFVASSLKELLSDVMPHKWDAYLTKLGDEGWELVSVNMWNDGYDGPITSSDQKKHPATSRPF